MFRHNTARRAFFAILGLTFFGSGTWFLKLDSGAIAFTPAETLAIVGGQGSCYGQGTATCPSSGFNAECEATQCDTWDIECPPGSNYIYPIVVCEVSFAYSDYLSSYPWVYSGASPGYEEYINSNVTCGEWYSCDTYEPTCDALKSHCVQVPSLPGLRCPTLSEEPDEYTSSQLDYESLECPTISGWLRARDKSDPLFAAAVFNGVWFSASFARE